MSNIFRVNTKGTGTTSCASIVNLEHILYFIPLLMLPNLNKKVLVGPEKRLFRTLNLFSLTVRNLLSYELGKLVGLFIFKLNPANPSNF